MLQSCRVISRVLCAWQTRKRGTGMCWKWCQDFFKRKVIEPYRPMRSDLRRKARFSFIQSESWKEAGSPDQTFSCMRNISFFCAWYRMYNLPAYGLLGVLYVCLFVCLFVLCSRHQISIATELCAVLGSRSPSIEPTVRTQLVFACMTSISRVLCGTDCSAGELRKSLGPSSPLALLLTSYFMYRSTYEQ